MIGGTNAQNFLVDFNASEWANQANAQLQTALNQGLKYSEKYSKQAANAMQDYHQQARQDINQGFQQAQALNAPQRLATYNALDAYQGTLGLPTPQGGSFQLASGMQNQVTGQPNTPQQQQQAQGFNQGVQQINPKPGLFSQGGQ